MRISQLEIDILKAVQRGESPRITPAHRLRFEMLGLARDTPQALVLTPAGEEAAQMSSSFEPEAIDTPVRRRDAAGRKRMLERSFPVD